MSDRKKTIIDCVDRLRFAGGVSEVRQMLAAASRRLDWQKLVSYLERIGSVSLAQRVRTSATPKHKNTVAAG